MTPQEFWDAIDGKDKGKAFNEFMFSHPELINDQFRTPRDNYQAFRIYLLAKYSQK